MLRRMTGVCSDRARSTSRQFFPLRVCATTRARHEALPILEILHTHPFELLQPLQRSAMSLTEATAVVELEAAPPRRRRSLDRGVQL